MERSPFNQDAEEFDKQIKEEKPEVIERKRKINHHENRRYIVKLPGEIMKLIDYKEGDSLVFTLTITKTEKKLKVEYESAVHK
jgi:hypothetical protein